MSSARMLIVAWMAIGLLEPGCLHRSALALPEGPPGATVGDTTEPLGGVDAAVDVSLSTGAAGTSIPIEVPPGRGGMQPNLALVYSSQAGAGPYLGVGWDLPIGRIERSRRNGAPCYCNCPSGRLDEFVLILSDGAIELTQRDANRFFARVDESHIDVRRVISSANYWTVRDTSGRVYTFGDVPLARVGPDPNAACSTYAWYLTSVRDPNQNQVDFTYTQYTDSVGVAYPTSVSWGKRGTTLPQHYYRVDFLWTARTLFEAASPISFAAGFKQEFAAVLDEVRVYYLPSTLIRRYALSWIASAGTSRPLLERVQLYGYGDVPLRRGENGSGPDAAWEFDYLESERPVFASASSTNVHIQNFRNQHCQSKGWPCTKGRDFVDLDRDGRVDVVRASEGAGSNWNVYLNSRTGDRFPSAVPWASTWDKMMITVQDGDQSASGTRLALADLNRDALPDLIRAQHGESAWKVFYNVGTGFAATFESWPVTASVGWIQKRIDECNVDGDCDSKTTWDLIDLNGDGLPDRIGAGSWTPSNLVWNVQWNTGKGGANAWRSGVVHSPKQHIRVVFSTVDGDDTDSSDTWQDLFDINGDGLPDIVHTPAGVAPGENPSWNVWFGTGTGFVGADGVVQPGLPNVPAKWYGEIGTDPCDWWFGTWVCTPLGRVRSTNEPGTSDTDLYRRDTVDVTADGLPDLVSVTPLGGEDYAWRVRINTGRGFSEWVDWDLTRPLRRETADASKEGLVWDTLDIDGDGYVDQVRTKPDETADIYYGHAADDGAGGFIDAPQDALIWTRNPIGAETFLDYQVSAHFDTGAVHPGLVDGIGHLPFPIWAVSTITREGLTTAYEFDGGYYDPERRAFRGFHRATVKQPNQVRETTYFHQIEPLAGKRYLTRTHLGDGPVDAATLKKQEWTCGYSQQNMTWLGVEQERFFPRMPYTWRTDFDGTSDAWTAAAPASNRVTFTAFDYDECGNITSEQVFDFNTFEMLKETTSTYNIQGCDMLSCATGTCDKVASISVTGGLSKTFAYDSIATGNLTRVTLVGDGTPHTDYTYHATSRNLETVTDALGRETKYFYGAPGDPTQITVWKTCADNTGLQECSEVYTDPKFGKPLKDIDVSGFTISYAYDAFGRKIKEAEEPDNTLAAPTRKFAYTWMPGTQRIQRIDQDVREPNAPSGYRRRAVFADLLGRPLQAQERRAVGATATTVVIGATRYDAAGRVEKAYVPTNVGAAQSESAYWDQFTSTHAAMTFVYDGFSRVIRRTAPDTGATTTSYRKAWVVRTCDAVNVGTGAGMCQEEEHDALGRLVLKRTFASPTGAPTLYSWHQFHYDLGGRIDWEEQNGGNNNTRITYDYDDFDRKILVDDPDSGEAPDSGHWLYTYDAVGNVLCQDDPKDDQHVWFVYDGLNRIVAREQHQGECPLQGATVDTTPLLEVAEHVYYAQGAPAYGRGRLAESRVKSYRTGAAEVTSEREIIEYDARGNPRQVRQTIRGPAADGDKSYLTFNTYDIVGRLKTTTLPLAAGEETLTYRYGAEGVLLQVLSDSYAYVNTIVYDELGRLTQLYQANGVVDTYTYWSAKGVETGGGTSPGRGYQMNRIETSGPSGLLRRYQHATYNRNGAPTSLGDLQHAADSTLHNSWTATFDNQARLKTWTRSGGSALAKSYAYDALGNLTQKDGKTYTYGAAGPHQVTAVGADAVSYDPNGSMAHVPGNRGLAYDAAGRLVRVCQGPCSGAAPEKARYEYDADGRRVLLERPDGTAIYFFDGFDYDTATATNTRHISAGGRPIAQSPQPVGSTFVAAKPPVVVARAGVGGLLVGLVVLVAVGSASARRRPGAGPARVALVLLSFVVLNLRLPPLARAQCPGDPEDPPAGIVFYQLDRLGGTELATDAAGAAVEYLRYRPYGGLDVFSPTGTVKSAADSTFQFTGHRGNEGAALYYFGARFYDPGLGLFPTPDPARQFFSPYAYGPGNPLSTIDPTGAFDLGSLIFAIILIVASATAVGADTLAAGGSAWDGFKAASITGTIATATAGLAGPVGAAATAALGPTVAPIVLAVGGAALASYGAAQAFQAGYVASGFVGVFGAALSVAALGQGLSKLRAPASKIAMPSDAALPEGMSQSEVPQFGVGDLQPGDFLLTGEGGLAQYLKGTGEYGHGAIVIGTEGDRLEVLSSDNRGIYTRFNDDPAVGGRTWDVFRAQGVEAGRLEAFARGIATEGGLRQYLGNAGGNVCTSVCARALGAAGGPVVPPGVGQLVTPNALG